MASAHLTSSSTDDSLARLNFAAEQEVGINEQIKCASCHYLAMPNTGFLLLDPHLLSSILLSLLCGGHSASDTELPVWGWVPLLVDKSF